MKFVDDDDDDDDVIEVYTIVASDDKSDYRLHVCRKSINRSLWSSQVIVWLQTIKILTIFPTPA